MSPTPSEPRGPGRHRLFYALWPDALVAERLEGLQAGVAGKKTQRQDFHLTLAFLGEQPAQALPVLESVLNRLSSPDMTLVLDRYGCFKRLDLLWAGMSSVPQALFDLQLSLSMALRASGIAFKQETAFRPHITLARKVKTMPETDFSPIVWSAYSLVLARSESMPGEGRYRILASR